MSSKKEEKENYLFERIVSASGGAIVTSFLMTPLDVVKTRLQAQSKSIPLNCVNSPSQMVSCPQCKLYYFNNGLIDLIDYKKLNFSFSPICQKMRFKNTIDAFIKIFKHEKITSFQRGLLPTLYMAIPATVLYFNTYEVLKQKYSLLFSNKYQQLTPLFAGMTARIVAATFTSPLEMLRTQLQSNFELYSESKSVFSMLKKRVSTNGIKSLWRGLSPTLARDVPFSALYQFGYENLKQKAFSNLNYSDYNRAFLISFISGAISGCVAAVIVTPFDVIKTRCQIRMQDSKIQPITSTFTSLIKEEGLTSLLSGIGARLIRIPLACGIMISSYELGKKFFRSKSIEK